MRGRSCHVRALAAIEIDTRATQVGATLRGNADLPDPNNARARAQHAFTPRRLPQRPPGPPRRIAFTPTDYANMFSADRAPVLTIWPGDSVHTTTLDSGGVDGKGITRALYGNPQTGPFFVAGAGRHHGCARQTGTMGSLSSKALTM